MSAWYRDRAALALIGKRYLPILAGLNLVWEIAQVPLYTLWREASPAYMAFAVAHCTAGDVLVGAGALAMALTATRAGSPGSWRWREITVAAVLLGVAYTAASEWLNTQRGAWQYSNLMPIVRVGRLRVGAAPLAQWLILPPIALYVSRRKSR